MSRLINTATAVTVLSLLSTSAGLLTADERPNFVLLMGDDHGWDEVGYNGHPHLKTPVLDEMASQGLRFDRFYAGHPSCSPTRGSFMTGRHPNRYGTFSPGWSIRPEEISFAHILSKAGYACAHYGKWHLGPVKRESPTNPGAMGFDEWFSHDNFFEMNPTLSRNGAAPQMIEGEGSQIIVDQAMGFVQKARLKKQPFCVVVWFGSPHEPYSGLPDDLALYDDLPAAYAERTVQLTSNETGQRVTRSLRAVLRERYAEITAMDRAIGSLRDFLKKQNLSENTLVWYCGDNGTPASAGRTAMTIRAQKGSLYEGGVRVPGVIEWPSRLRQARVIKSNAVTSDILPTLCDLAGQSLPIRPLDGISLVPAIDGAMQNRRRPIFFWRFSTSKAINQESKPYIDPQLQEGTTPLVKMLAGKYTRTFRNFHYPAISQQDFGGPRTMLGNRYKLVMGEESADESDVELFDLSKDPTESHNLAASHPAIVQAMQKQLRDWQKSVLQSLMGEDYK